MPVSITFSDEVSSALNLMSAGIKPESKIHNLIEDGLMYKISYFQTEIGKFEAKYGMSCSDFKNKWENDEIEEKHSYEIKSDFIDWEMYEGEKQELISTLSKLRSYSKNKNDNSNFH